LQDSLKDNSQLGTLVPMTIEMKAVTVAGTVIYVVGEPVAANHGLQVQLPESSVQTRPVYIPGGGIGEDDNSVLASKLSPTEVGVGVVRNNDGRVTAIRYVDLDRLGLLGDTASLDPGERVKRYESYSVTGFIPATTPEGLRASGTDYPGWVTRDYLQLPDTLPQRVRDKAAEWAGSADNPYDKAIAIQTKLRDYLYDTNIPDTPAGEDNVDYFLFTLGRGYFDYHASAMVVMLRSLGVPARLAVGFAVDDTNRDASGAYVVKDKNSYAWPEVYFPGTGWVPFNPTPDRPADLSPRSDASAPVSRDHNAEDLVPAAVSGFVPPEGEDINPGTSTTPLAGASGSSDQPLAWYISAAVTLFLAALVGAVILGWQRSVAGLPYPQQIWEKTVRLAGWGGIRPQPGQTPHDYARGLGKRFRDVQDDMPVLADAYVKSRFGRKDLSDEEIAAVKDTWPEVRANLVGGIGGRFFRRRKKTG
jgi:transglutaminase-like putative cysteine protease